jgi:hypothetical protein
MDAKSEEMVKRKLLGVMFGHQVFVQDLSPNRKQQSLQTLWTIDLR